MTQAVFRFRQASQGRFLRLRGCRGRPNWLWMVNLRGRPWAESAPLSMVSGSVGVSGARSSSVWRGAFLRRVAVTGLCQTRGWLAGWLVGWVGRSVVRRRLTVAGGYMYS